MTHSIHYLQHEIRYYAEGEGEILLFLHGWPTNHQLWAAQVEHFKTRYRVITLDWLGFGASDKPTDFTYAFAHKKAILDLVVADILPLDSYREGETLSLIAHDIGGPAAILWASENQAKLKRLVLLNTVIYPFSTFLDSVSHSMFVVPGLKQIIMSEFGQRILLRTLSRSRGKALNQRIEKVLAAHQNWQTNLKVKTILDPLKTAKQNEFQQLASLFKKLSIERHLIIAKKDPLCYAHIKKLQAENPDVPAHFVEKCGHFIALDQPEKLNEILEEILG